MVRRLASRAIAILTVIVVLIWAGTAYQAGAAATADPGTPDTAARHVVFATYNVDFGADLAPIFSAPPADLIHQAHIAYQSMLALNYKERAAALAHLVAKERPDVVSLQEADTWETSLPGSPFTMTENDFPTLLTNDLAAEGVPYAMIKNLTAQAALPIDLNPGTVVRYTDYNLILIRTGLQDQMLSATNQQVGQFSARIPLPSYLHTNLTRGWASADVSVWGRTFRFFATHLEAYNEAVRSAQATELAAMVARSPFPVVVAGDLNSYPTGCPNAIQTPAYHILELAGLVEIWPSVNQQHPCTGFTAGQSSLSSPTSNLNHRVDHIFFQLSRWDAIQAEVIGDQLRDKTPSGLWPSDHAGTLGTLRMTSGW